MCGPENTATNTQSSEMLEPNSSDKYKYSNGCLGKVNFLQYVAWRDATLFPVFSPSSNDDEPDSGMHSIGRRIVSCFPLCAAKGQVNGKLLHEFPIGERAAMKNSLK